MFNIAILLLTLLSHSSSILCQNSLQIMTLHRGEYSSNMAPVRIIGVSVDEEKLNEVSNSVLLAENWLRINVLQYYPSSNIKSVIVTNSLLCNGGNNRNDGEVEVVRLVVNSLKNLHYSLTRWGLEREIKVSVSVTNNCLGQSHIKPVLGFLEEINSTYTVKVSPTQFSDEIVKLLVYELNYANDLGVFRSETVNVMFPEFIHAKSTSRKLWFVDYLWSASSPPPQVVQFSPSPAPAPEIQSPASSPSHPYGYSLPPCNPYPHGYHAAAPVVGNYGRPVAAPPVAGNHGGAVAAAPRSGGEEELWCVAKPSVPSEKLQEAMDYACGAGGADCGPIRPNGSCFSPDSVVAHASYAFNSYWQKNKRNGGGCGFEGTAMLISSDPSFLHCRFILG